MQAKKLFEGVEWILTQGVSVKIILESDKIQFLLVKMASNAVIPMHNHLNEQMGICLKGKALIKTKKEESIVEENSVYKFASNEEHSVKALEETIFLDVFSPPREDYSKKQKNAEQSYNQ
ncbi:cupin domain-containing protein [Candidatus Bathyarchaeota archaeon]|nr:cupin domain-containing protein [Candidatus Bathyarchaeota archaeon]